MTTSGFHNARMVRYDRWIRNKNLKAIPYQKKGVSWALERELRFTDEIKGGIIADEMGMGKTYMVLGAMMANPNAGLTLLVVPPALLEQWEDIIKKFLSNADGFLIKYHGPKAKNIILDEDLLKRIGTRVVLTTYGMMANRKIKEGKPKYRSSLWGVNWYRTIYDEAHHMRNPRSNNWIGAKMTNCKIRWLMTGTPIQNYRRDIYSLVRLIDTTRSIADLCLHRDKASVGLQLPPIETNIINVDVSEMADAEANLINQLHAQLPFAGVTLENVDRYIELFEGKGIFPLLTAARQACLYPPLLVNRWKKLIARGEIDTDIELPNVDTHSKLNAVVSTINSRDRHTQKIIFTHYYGEIDRLEVLLHTNGYSVGKIDGRTPVKTRKMFLHGDKQFNNLLLNRLFKGGQLGVRKNIAEYLDIPDILLLQIKSCCEGLNLQQYTEIYFTSPHWNPATEDQAIARAHRIGQNKPVKVFKFITKLPPNGGLMAFQDSLDEYCLYIQEKKRELMAELKDRSTTHL